MGDFEPHFSTDWERQDYERRKRGEPELGPFGLRKGEFQLPAEVFRRHGADLVARLNGSATAEEGEVSNVSKWAIVIGGPVVYVDSVGRERPALITNTFGPSDKNPSINVVVVNDDENQTDSYGRKIERFTSVPHQDQQYAHGNYWKPISE